MPGNYIETSLNKNNDTIIADSDITTEKLNISDIDLSLIPEKCPCCNKSTSIYSNLATTSNIVLALKYKTFRDNSSIINQRKQRIKRGRFIPFNPGPQRTKCKNNIYSKDICSGPHLSQ